MKVWRAHGLGNDYLVWEGARELSPAQVRALCDRHEGPGGDGVLEPRPVERGGSHAVRIWNPDGSIAEKSGNGLRIFTRWLTRSGVRGPIWVDTGFEVVRCEDAAGEVRVDMGRATSPGALQRCLLPDGRGVDGLIVSIGNPHFVVPSVPDDWRRVGAALERHPDFPGRTNVQFVAWQGRSAARAWIWERGAGETRASGSSACAVAFAGVALGVSDPGKIEVRMDGGALVVDVGADGHVRQRGPVVGIGVVTLDPEWVSAFDRLG